MLNENFDTTYKRILFICLLRLEENILLYLLKLLTYTGMDDIIGIIMWYYSSNIK